MLRAPVAHVAQLPGQRLQAVVFMGPRKLTVFAAVLFRFTSAAARACVSASCVLSLTSPHPFMQLNHLLPQLCFRTQFQRAPDRLGGVTGGPGLPPCCSLSAASAGRARLRHDYAQEDKENAPASESIISPGLGRADRPWLFGFYAGRPRAVCGGGILAGLGILFGAGLCRRRIAARLAEAALVNIDDPPADCR